MNQLILWPMSPSLTKTIIVLVLFLLLGVSLSQAITTTLPSGETYTGNIQAGTAYIAVPKMDGTGTYTHYLGFQSSSSALPVLQAQLSGLSNTCGTNGATPDGFDIQQNDNSALTVYVKCKNLDGTYSRGISGAVLTSCPINTGYVNTLSSPDFIACTVSGTNMAKAAGTTGSPSGAGGAGAINGSCSTCFHINSPPATNGLQK